MICFISTFPPIICGVGTYTKYITDHLSSYQWKVVSFRLDDRFFSVADLSPPYSDRVNYCLSYPYCPFDTEEVGDFLWFQHSFGIWEDRNGYFLDLIEEAKKRKMRVGVSFHTVHFQSEETPSGITERESKILSKTLPLVDFLTVFTDGAYQAVVGAFPEYRARVIVLRHGVHLYPEISVSDARRELLAYLINRAGIAPSKKKELCKSESRFYSQNTILLGNYGFINSMKNPLDLYTLGDRIQEMLPHHRVITMFMGVIQNEREKNKDESRAVLEQLKSIHNGREKLFFEEYIPERLVPQAFGALDFTVFWSKAQTQSGRMAHAQGTGTCVVGINWEGTGETCRLSGLPAGKTLEELAEIIAGLVLEPERKEATRTLSREYALRHSFARQAQKHLLVEQALKRGAELPSLNGRNNQR